MKVIILGAGQVGYSIARYLSSEENDITLVDHSEEILKRISDKLDVQPVLGFASHPEVLKKANAQDADLLIAVTASDEVNMIACEVAQSLFQIPTKIARIRHQNYLKPAWAEMFNSHRLAIDVAITPEIEVAKSLVRSTQIVGAFEVISLAFDKIKVIGVHCHDKSPLINTPLRLISTQFPRLDIAIICISRGDDIFFPSDSDCLQEGDDVYFLVKAEDVDIAMEAFGYFGQEHRRMIIVGAGNIGLSVAQELELNNSSISTKIIEKDPKRSEFIAHNLKNIEILRGDALDLDVLKEANVQETETILALTDDDKVNILVSLLAKKQGTKRAISLMSKMGYAGLVTSLGVDAVVSPRSITVSTILQYIRQGRMQQIHTISEGFAEIIEAEAKETSQIIGLTVEDITIKNGIHVVAVIRGADIILLPQRLIISIGDKLIILAKKDVVFKVEKLFSIRPSYL